MSEKDVGMRIRLERTLREEFVEACRAQDLPAAQVLRAFMRDYVSLHRREPSNDDAQTQRAKETKGE